MFEEILNGFTDELEKILQLDESQLKKANQGIRLCNKTIATLQKAIKRNDFENSEKEINFFKNIKPYPMSYLIYFTEIRSSELMMPKAGNAHKVRFLEKEVRKVNKFFSINNDFVHYMEQHHGYLDHQFFTRTYREDYPFTPTVNYYQYPEFSTSHDMLWAKIQALYRYIHYLRDRLHAFRPDCHDFDFGKKHKLLLWTGNKVALVELIYALYASGDLNHGTTDIQAICASFEDIFNVRLDNIYKIYSEIKSRKGDRTKYLKDLMLHLERKMVREDA